MINPSIKLQSAALTQDYMRFQSHIHAIASVRAHGGGFAICYDHSEPYFESGDDDNINSVAHVWAIHGTQDGLVARDIFGDFPATKEEMRARLCAFFPDIQTRFASWDVPIDDQCTLAEILELSGDGYHQPLCGATEENISIAAALPSVIAMPGRNPAPSIEMTTTQYENYSSPE